MTGGTASGIMMAMHEMSPVYFSERVSASLPPDMHAAAVKAAVGKGLTLADYLRGALQSRLTLDGMQFERMPDLQRVTYHQRIAAR